MNKTILGLSCLIAMGWGGFAVSNDTKFERQVRTYMDYSKPIDPVVMVTIPDMNLSYALAGTLVEWDKSKQLISGIASKWETLSEKTIRFHIRKNLKWSDGSPLISSQIKASFENALKRHPEDLRSLANLLQEIRVSDDASVDFVLKTPVNESGFLGKLTEPNYGVLKISETAKPVIGITSGPYFVEKETENELTLSRNSNWFKANSEMPEKVVVRRPVGEFDSDIVLLKDTWANLIETTSMIGEDALSTYEKGNFQIWRRYFDKMGAFRLSQKLANETGFGLLRYLAKNINRTKLFKGLRGYELTDQAFPRGYQLHDPNFRCSATPEKLPDEYKRRPLKILITPARVGSVLRENIVAEITRLTGIKPDVISVPLQDLAKARKAGDFDFSAGTVGMADPDPEGIMSYYFEGSLPMIPQSKENFIERLDQARKEKSPEKKLSMMRAIMTDATCKGHLLPLYHFSTVGIGRSEFDFSNIPLSDESVTLSKIRFKKKSNP